MSDRIEIVPYDPQWPHLFVQERDRLAASLHHLAVRIEHNGSTSVPGLAAKPIIDIQISLRCLKPLDAYAQPLATLGYVHVAHVDDAFAPFFHKPASWPHSHHVHVVEAGGSEERRTLAFRDYLRDQPDAAAHYAALKHDLAARFNPTQAGAQDAYADAKGAFIEDIIRRALAAGYPRDL